MTTDCNTDGHENRPHDCPDIPRPGSGICFEATTVLEEVIPRAQSAIRLLGPPIAGEQEEPVMTRTRSDKAVVNHPTDDSHAGELLDQRILVAIRKESIPGELIAHQPKGVRAVKPLGQGQSGQHREELEPCMTAQAPSPRDCQIPHLFMARILSVHKCQGSARVEQKWVSVGRQGAIPLPHRRSTAVLPGEATDGHPPHAGVIPSAQ